jgi:hypothetical protein
VPVEAAGLPLISLYEGTKHSMAADAIRRGVAKRHLQTFLGHESNQSTSRYTRLADNAMLEALRPKGSPRRRTCRSRVGAHAEAGRRE